MSDDITRDSFSATMRFAELAVRSVLILNGGAALGLLTFASNQTKNGSPNFDYAAPVWWFGMGAALAVFTAGLSYLAQLFFTQASAPGDWQEKLGTAIQIVAVFVWLTSITLFVLGVTTSAETIRAV